MASSIDNRGLNNRSMLANAPRKLKRNERLSRQALQIRRKIHPNHAKVLGK
jgi:hypothetical protein